MKKFLCFALTCFLLVGTISAKPKKTKKSKKNKSKTEFVLSNEIDSMCYAAGILLGNESKKMVAHAIDGTPNYDMFLHSFSQVLHSDSTIKMSINVADSLLGTYVARIQKEKNEKQIAQNKAFLEENAKREGVQTTASGLQYEIIKQTRGIMPGPKSKVKVHYHGTLIDGTVFDSSVQRGEEISFRLDQVIAGWQEGVQLMPVGSTYKFFIPAELGYGARDMGTIPANSTLIFEVQLLEIEELNNN